MDRNDPCRWVGEQIDLYVDKAVTSEDAVEVDAHLTTCSNCRKQLHLAREIREGLQAFPALDIPDETQKQWMAAMQRVSRRSGSRRFLTGNPIWKWAVAAVLVLATVHYGSRQQPERTPAYSQASVTRAAQQATWAIAFVSRTTRNATATAATRALREGITRPILTGMRKAGYQGD